MSSNDFALFTANTNKNPSPVLIYWSLIALQNKKNLSFIIIYSQGFDSLIIIKREDCFHLNHHVTKEQKI